MKNQNFLLKIILVVLCLHLLYTNAEILLSTIENGNAFQKILMCFFGMSYSLLTTISIYKLNKILPIIIFSFMDGFAVYMRIDDIKTAIFYGLYTSIIVIVSFAIKQKETKENQKISEDNQSKIKINQLENKLNQSEIKINQLENKLNQSEIKIQEYENKEIDSVIKSLAKISDPEIMKEKIFANKLLSDEIKNQILSKKIKTLSNYEQPIPIIQQN